MREPKFRWWVEKPNSQHPGPHMEYESMYSMHSKNIPMLFSQVYGEGNTPIYEGDVIMLGFSSHQVHYEIFFSRGAFWGKPLDGNENDHVEMLYNLQTLYRPVVVGNIFETKAYQALRKDSRRIGWVEGV